MGQGGSSGTPSSSGAGASPSSTSSSAGSSASTATSSRAGSSVGSTAGGSGVGGSGSGATATQPRPGVSARQRRVKLTVSRVDPWSAMKMSFLISVAIGIAGVVMVAVLWMILSGMGVFTQINSVVAQVINDNENPFNIMDFLGFRRVLSLSIVIGVIDVILLTALSTLGAFLYNICSSLVGGIQLTLTDD
nr:DUF3566 domain-containing protein [Knoellia sp. DB2414S]